MNDIEEITSVELWQSTSNERRKEICIEILSRLPKRYKLIKPFIAQNPINNQPIEVPCFYDEKYETPLNLIFGGYFQYGSSHSRIEEIRNKYFTEEWHMISNLIHQSKEIKRKNVTPFLMSRFPLYEWVAEENIDLSTELERPDFSCEDGPYPIYISTNEASQFLKKTGYRIPWDFEWEYVAKDYQNNLFISGNEIPNPDALEKICLTQFGDAKLNKEAANHFGIASLSVATFTRTEHQDSDIIIRGGAAGFYPFQQYSQFATLLTEIQLPISNMPGELSGLRLCLDIPKAR
jgi:hypothetical protein